MGLHPIPRRAAPEGPPAVINGKKTMLQSGLGGSLVAVGLNLPKALPLCHLRIIRMLRIFRLWTRRSPN